jgi:hypothetical protein
MTLPTSKERVPAHTTDTVNAKIMREMAERIAALARRPSSIPARLRELDKEWDIERMIEANAATLALLGTLLGFFAHPYWLILPALVTVFLLQHALQGWCPPVPILRRLGFRAVYEIEQERHALKAIRGDFAAVMTSPNAAAAAIAATAA